MRKTTYRCGLAAGFLTANIAAGAADAHVVLADATAAPGAYYTSFFRVGHGCAGSATTALRVELPESIVMARPQPKPGWTVTIERTPLATPVASEGGKPVTERVKALVWRGGPLPDEQWDQFGFMAKLPDAPGKLYFPTVQTCEQGEARWVETTAAPGQHLSHPAPTLTIAEGGADDMAGMDMSGMDMSGVGSSREAKSPPPLAHAHKAGIRHARAVTIEGAWIATPPNGAPTAAGYLTIRNDADAADSLIAAASPAARSVSVHAMSMAGGVMRMRPVTDGLAIPPHGTAVLTPSGGYHLMFAGPTRPLKTGDGVKAILRFKTAGAVAVTFEVKPLSGA